MAIYLTLGIIAIITRLAPHPANVAPMGALALFIGTYSQTQPKRGQRVVALCLPLITMVLSDALIGFYTWPVMAVVYGSLAFTMFLGQIVRKYYCWSTIMLVSLTGSIIFFLLTNAAVWAFTPMYTKTIQGLIESYIMALPFFRNSLIGDLGYTFCLFGAYRLANRSLLLKEATWLQSQPKHQLS